MQHLRFDDGLFIGKLFRTAIRRAWETTHALFRSFWMIVQSKALEAVSYDEAQSIHIATFRDGRRTYAYEGVSRELYDRLLFSGSISAFFNRHIRDHFRAHEI